MDTWSIIIGSARSWGHCGREIWSAAWTCCEAFSFSGPHSTLAACHFVNGSKLHKCGVCKWSTPFWRRIRGTFLMGIFTSGVTFFLRRTWLPLRSRNSGSVNWHSSGKGMRSHGLPLWRLKSGSWLPDLGLFQLHRTGDILLVFPFILLGTW